MIETTNKTKLLGIIGTPVEHTLSPKMHSYMARKNNEDLAYLAFDVANGDFKNVVDTAKKMGALGFNITSPYKVEVMDCLDEIDEEAQRMGSVNTIVNREGKWYGYNTDGAGFVGALVLDGYALKGKKILMLGAGGSARSVSYKFAQQNVGSITISARNGQNIAKIGDVITQYTDVPFYGEMDDSTEYDYIVNTTPLGMHPHEGENPFAAYMDKIHSGTVCCDLIYNPRKTLFLREAEKRGAKLVNGLPMLVLQGIYAFSHYIGRDIDVSIYGELMDLLGEFKI